MKLTYRGQIDKEGGKFVIVGCRFDAEGGPVNFDEMLSLVREAWASDQHADVQNAEEKKT